VACVRSPAPIAIMPFDRLSRPFLLRRLLKKLPMVAGLSQTRRMTDASMIDVPIRQASMINARNTVVLIS
jgi:hypothetical protein